MTLFKLIQFNSAEMLSAFKVLQNRTLYFNTICHSTKEEVLHVEKVTTIHIDPFTNYIIFKHPDNKVPYVLDTITTCRFIWSESACILKILYSDCVLNISIMSPKDAERFKKICDIVEDSDL